MPHIPAAVMPGPDLPVEIREIPEPDLEIGSALLEVELSEVCGTDVYLRQGRLAGVPYPIIPGHVSVGRLGKIRGTIRDVQGKPFAEGDRVTFLDVHKTCNACYQCLVVKSTTRCPSRKVYGITYGLDDGLTGGWCSRLYLKPDTRVIRLENTDFEAFMAGGCGLPTALHAVEQAEVSLGDTVLVLGAGPVGLSCVAFAKMSGALRVLCIGAPDHRLETARFMGADKTCSIETQSGDQRLRWVLDQTDGRGADITIEATGAPAAVVQAMQYTRDAGRAVIVGQYTDHGEITFNPHLDLNKKHLDIRGCWGSDFSHFYRGAQIMSDPAASKPWTHMQLDRYALNQANDAIDAVAFGRVVKALIDPNL
jgi:L-iditol 2-dehydrogenase